MIKVYNNKMTVFLCGILFLLFYSSSLQAQLTVDSESDAQVLLEELLGVGVTVSNVQLTCPGNGAGIFTATNTNLGMGEGIILSTGLATNAIGPNNSGSTSTSGGAPGDADLSAIASGFSTCDACILEFDFIPTASTLTFSYVFGSEEYLEYVNSSFNDAFALFISGPGFTGQENIALLPGTTTPVTIDNVNTGLNSSFYVNNGNGSQNNGTIEYDGFTTVLNATATVIPCETYTLKIGVADAGDCAYDSGVFLQAGSLGTDVAFGNPIENCNDNGSYTLTFPFTGEGDNNVYTLSEANAGLGIDDVMIIDDGTVSSVTIGTYPNGSSYDIMISAMIGVCEDNFDLNFSGDTDCEVTVCTDPATADAGEDLVVCGSTVDLNAIANGPGSWSGGTGTYTNQGNTMTTYTAGPAEIGSSVRLTWTTNDPDEEGICTEMGDAIDITFNIPASAAAGPDQTVCGLTTVNLNATASGAGSWSGGNGSFGNATSTSTTYTPAANELGSSVGLTWTTADPDGNGPCPAVSDGLTLTFNAPASANAGEDQTLCGLTTANLSATVSGGGSWSGGNGSFGSVNIANTIYTPAANELGATVTLTWTTNDPDGDGPCTSTSDALNVTFNAEASVVAGDDQVVCGLTTVNLNAIASGAGSWSGGNGSFANSTSTSTIYTPTANELGSTVSLTWTTTDPDGDGPCTSVSDAMNVTFNAPATADAGENQAVCGLTTVSLSATANGTGSWSGGSGSFSNANNTNTTYTPATSELGSTISLIWTTNDPDEEGPCTSVSDAMNVTFNNDASAEAGDDQTVCGTDPISLNATASGPGMWSGGFGSFANSTSTSTTYTPTALELGSVIILTWTTADPDGDGPCTSVNDALNVTINNPATAVAGEDQTVCGLTPVSLSSTASGLGTWSGGSGSFSNVNGTSTTYTPDAGELGATVSLTWTTTDSDGEGPCTSASDALNVTFSTPAVVEVNAEQAICSENPVITLTGTISGGATTGTWTGGGGTFSPNNTSLNVTYTPTAAEIAANSATIILTSNAPDGPCTESAGQIVVTIEAAAIADAGDDQTICAGQSANIVGVTSGGAFIGSWSGGAGTYFPNLNSAEATYTPDPSEIGTTVQLTWTTNEPEGLCPAASDVVEIQVLTGPTANAGTDITVCGAIDVPLSASVGGLASSGTWSSANTGVFSDVNDPNAIFTPFPSQVGTTVELTWTTDDPEGPCTPVSDVVNVIINEGPSVEIMSTQPTVCETDQISLNVNTNAGGSWSVLNGAGSFLPNNTSTSVTYTPAAADINTALQFVWTSNDPDGAGPCVGTSESTEVFVNLAPTVSLSAVGDTICAPDPDSLELFPGIALEAILGGSATGGFWSGGLGTIEFPNSPSQAVYTPDPSEYNSTVTLNWTTNDPDGNGPCSAITESVEFFVVESSIVGEIIVTGSSACGLNGDDCDGSIAFTLLSGPSPGVYEIRFIFGTTDTTAFVNGMMGAPPTVTLTGLCTNGYFIVSVTPPQGCTDIISKFISVEDPDSPDSPEPTSNAPVCLGEDLQLFANVAAGPGEVYFWQGPNGFVSFDENPIVSDANIDNIGLYNLTLISNGCNSVPGIVEVELTTGPDAFASELTACENDYNSGMASFDLTAADSDAAGGSATATVTYYATQADAESGANPLPSTYTGPSTSLFVRVEDAAGCVSITNLALTVIPLEDLGNIQVERVCAGNHLYVIDTDNAPNPVADNSDFQYNWYLDGVLVSSINGIPYFAPTQTGVYTVVLIDLTTCGAFDSFAFPYEVDKIIDCTDCGD